MAETNKTPARKAAQAKPRAKAKAQPKLKGAAELRNVTVKALRPHANLHGSKHEKRKGETYIHPRPHADIQAGLVEVSTNESSPDA